MAQNLQNFVEQLFPSIAKRINFRFGTLRGINLYITGSEFPTCSVRNVVEQKKFFFFENITEFITNYKTLLKEQLSDCDNNIHFNTLVDMLTETQLPRAREYIEIRDGIYNEALVFDYVKSRNGKRITRLIKSGVGPLETVLGVAYNKKTKKYRVQFTHNETQECVYSKPIIHDRIIEMLNVYNQRYYLNAPQLKKIEETLYALAVYNVTVRDKTSTTNSITV